MPRRAPRPDPEPADEGVDEPAVDVARAAAPSAGPEECDVLEAAVRRAARRLAMAERFSDLTLSLAEAVHGRALAEEAAGLAIARAAEAAAAAPEACELPAERAMASRGVAASEPKSGPKVARASSGKPAPLDGAALFTRLQATFAECLDLEAKAEATLGRLTDQLCLAREHHAARLAAEAIERDEKAAIEARLAVVDWVLPIIEEQAETLEEERALFAALWERLSEDHAYLNLTDLPPEVSAAGLFEDLELEVDWSRYTPDGWKPRDGENLYARPRWSPFNQPSRRPLLPGAIDAIRPAMDLSRSTSRSTMP